MSLGGKAKKPVAARAATNDFAARPGDEEDDAPAAAEAVSEMAAGEMDGKKKEVKVIPAMANTFALGGAQHLRDSLAPPAPALRDGSAGTDAPNVPTEPSSEP